MLSIDTLLEKINAVFELKEEYPIWIEKTLRKTTFRNKDYLRFTRYETYLRMWELVQIVSTIKKFCKTEKLSETECKILDVGCGLGRISLPLAHLGYDIVGVDVDHNSIQVAKESASNIYNIRFIHSDALSFFANNKGQNFHIIICSHVLEHVENPCKLIQAFSKALEPGGLLICIIPNPFGLLELCFLKPQHKLKKYLNIDTQQGRDHISGISLNWLTKALALSGFKIEMVLPVGSVFANPITSRSMIELIELQTPKPIFLAYSWIIIGKSCLAEPKSLAASV